MGVTNMQAIPVPRQLQQTKWRKLAAVISIYSLAALLLVVAISPPKTASAPQPPTTPNTIVLNHLIRVNAGSTNDPNYMTTLSDSPEYWTFRSSSDGAIFYIPRNQIPNTIPLYRLYAPSVSDHMDWNPQPTPTPLIVPSPYGTPHAILGYPWAQRTYAPGSVDLRRYCLATPYDQAMGIGIETPAPPPVTPVSPWATSPSAYGYGYRLWYNLPTQLQSVTYASDAGDITISSNYEAGGALWNLSWTPPGGQTIQFVNNYSYGRQIASYLFYRSHTDDSCGNQNLTPVPGDCYNPSEPGDAHSNFPLSNGTPEPNATFAIYTNNPALRHGSPYLMLATLTPGSPGSIGQRTSSVPLEFNPEMQGGDWYHPVIYPDVKLGKTVTLNFNNHLRILKYVTEVTLPSGGYPTPEATTIVPPLLQMPWVSLRAEFINFYKVDGATPNFLSDVSADTCNGSLTGWYPTSPGHFGGIIITNADNTAAMGLFAGSYALPPGGYIVFSASNHTHRDHLDPSCSWPYSTDEHAFASAEMSAAYVNQTSGLPGGSWSRAAFIVVGTRTQVEADLAYLYNHCTTIPTPSDCIP
jgi:hypothetical protein